MPKLIRSVWRSVGGLLDFSPHGKTVSRQHLETTKLFLENRQDRDAIAACYRDVGADMAYALKKFAHEQKHHNSKTD